MPLTLKDNWIHAAELTETQLLRVNIDECDNRYDGEVQDDEQFGAAPKLGPYGVRGEIGRAGEQIELVTGRKHQMTEKQRDKAIEPVILLE
ncbi:unnamed protein product [Dibothriocephalus latus]|uniref:Uncharacterized protein n=1 Tax=Dibothriocephalus latus TaxID=60516 RepID=A0A3P7LFP5_DIBLA|nr:unnamed protein product [Dibothriocephalus latus]